MSLVSLVSSVVVSSVSLVSLVVVSAVHSLQFYIQVLHVCGSFIITHTIIVIMATFMIKLLNHDNISSSMLLNIDTNCETWGTCCCLNDGQGSGVVESHTSK